MQALEDLLWMFESKTSAHEDFMRGFRRVNWRKGPDSEVARESGIIDFIGHRNTVAAPQ
jgi:hypothetical protein